MNIQRIFYQAIALMVLSGCTMIAMAVPITSGTGSYLSFRDCSGGGTITSGSTTLAACEGGLPVQRSADFTIGGASSTSASNPTLGNSAASAELTGTIGAPILHARAESSAIGRLGATSIAVQRYENTGPSSITAYFGGDLTFSLTNVATAGSVTFTGVEAQLALFTTPSGFIDVDTSLDRLAIFDLFVWDTLPGVSSVYDSGLVQYMIPTTISGISIPLSTPGISVAPGESFFVLARVLAIGAEGSTADASNTLVTNLYNSNDLETRSVLTGQSGLQAVASSVPEPGTLMLLVAGVIGVLMHGARGRRRVCSCQ